ncbi:hypothetical protein CL622_05215 [archaeon]|nr:hypothetical protein [archaeon]|tara:strand:- start:1565 stop:1906 length:342 start_codon:yes stop_codon:yes gene_type:complete
MSSEIDQSFPTCKYGIESSINRQTQELLDNFNLSQAYNCSHPDIEQHHKNLTRVNITGDSLSISAVRLFLIQDPHKVLSALEEDILNGTNSYPGIKVCFECPLHGERPDDHKL